MKSYLLICLFILNSCAIGYKKLTSEKLNSKLNKGKVELINYSNLDLPIKDTLAKIYERFRTVNAGHTKVQYHIPYFISFDSNVRGSHIKYQDFYSEKIRFPFGFFFRFGNKKFFIPYSEREIGQPFLYSDGYMYFDGIYFGKEVDRDTMNVKDPEYYRVDYSNSAYWKIKLK